MTESKLLRRAVENVPVPRDLYAKVRAGLDQPRPAQWGRLVSSLALLIVVAGGLQVAAVRKTRALLQTGVDDHVHCAIAGAYPRQTGQASMLRDLGPYAPMLEPILRQAPGAPVVSAHRCTAFGRTYVHVIMRRGGTLVSVILTRRSAGERFPRQIAARIVLASGVPIHEASLSGYSVAAFEAGSYLGYVISGLPAPENEALAARVAPVVRRYTGA